MQFLSKTSLKTPLVLLTLIFALIIIRWQFGMLLFHTLVEFFTVILGVLMLIIALNTRQFTKNNFLLFLGISFFYIAILDTLHTITIPGMPFFLAINKQTTLHFWLYGRLLEALTLLIAPLFLSRKLNPYYLFIVLAMTITLISWFAFAFDSPILITAQGLTEFKDNSEYLIIVILIAAIAFYVQKRNLFAPNVFFNMILAILFTIFAEYAFTLYLNFHSIPFVIGHLFKFVAFGLIYRAIVETTLKQPFSQLSTASSSYEALPHPAIIVDQQGIILQANSAAQRSIADSNKPLIGKPVHELFHPSNVTRTACTLCRAAENKEIFIEKVLWFPQQQRWYQVSSQIIDDSLVNHPLVLLLIDVTELKQTLNLLNKTFERLDQTQTVASIGSWEYDIINNKLWCSDEVYRIFELDKQTFKPSYDAFLQLAHPDERQRIDAATKASFENKQDYAIEYQILTKDGRSKFVNKTTKIICNEQGLAIISKGCIQDTTKWRQVAEVLHRNEKMEALGKLTGGIAHDFNNILGIILGYGEILVNHLQNDAKLHRYAEHICRAGARGADLTKKLLAFSKQKPTQIDCININQLVLADEDMLRKTLTALIDLEFNLATALKTIKVDVNALEDTLLNLCINSMHAMSNGGILTISTANTTLTAIEAQHYKINAGDYVTLSIEDNGCGMSAEVQARIFEPFFSTKQDQGTGLGLSQVYGFVNSSQGDIKVYSELGVGTRFVLYFPCCRDTASTITQKKLPSKTVLTGNETILVVDDEAQLIDLAGDILQSHGYRVITAINAHAALALLKNNHVDLLLSDIIMPKMNGYLLAEKVTVLYPQIKIVLASGFQNNLDESLESKSYQGKVIEKPYDAHTLLAAIRRELNSAKTAQKNTNKCQSIADTPLLQWDEEMCIDDNGLIDQGHKKLISLINQCQQMDRDKLFHQLFHQYLEELTTHIITHFQEEEAAMQACHYPFYTNHLDVHNLMKKQLSTVITTRSDQEIYLWLTTEFTEWAREHILGLDKAFASYLQQENVDL